MKKESDLTMKKTKCIEKSLYMLTENLIFLPKSIEVYESQAYKSQVIYNTL